MNIAIIGCGYVGKALGRFWKAAGHSVTATTRNPEHIEGLQSIVSNVVLLQGDIYETFVNGLANHQAVFLSMAADSPADYERTYFNTAQALVKALPKLPFLKQIIYTSSTSVYGEQQGHWVDESMAPEPTNRNAQILLETEDVLQTARNSGRQVCIFRLGEIYGPGREISERLRRMASRPLPGSGSNYTNLIHLNDIVGAADFALCHQLDGIYNLCNDLHISRREFYEIICEKHGLPKVIWDPSINSIHAGNKRVSNRKLIAAGYEFRER